MSGQYSSTPGFVRILGRGLGRVLFVSGLLLLALGADEDNTRPLRPAARPPEAYLIRIPLPITGGGDMRIKQMVDDVLERIDDGSDHPIIVFEFWPPSEESPEGSEFERSLSLARYLSSPELNRVRTVAYLPQSISGHAVLVAMACEQIIMHPDAELGDAGIDETTIDATVRSGYSEIADRHRTLPAPIALGMLDPELAVYRVTLGSGGTRVVLSDELDELSGVQRRDTLVEAGDMLLLRGDQMREYGFATHLAVDRNEVARSLKLPANALEIDPSLGQEWRGFRVKLSGPITASQTSQLRRLLEDGRIREQANFICIEIESPGGSPTDSMALANYLSSLPSTDVRTVAYIPRQALADAAVVAIACDHVVMHEGALLGGIGAANPNAKEVEDLTVVIRQIARTKSRSWSLIAAMFDPELEVHRYTLEGADVVEYFSEEELSEQVDPGAWTRGDEVTVPGEHFQANGRRAEQYRLARYQVESFPELRQVYHLQDDLVSLEPNWAHEFIEALSHPGVAGGLLFIGFLALIGELAAPGLGVSGFVAAVCFVLFFWSQHLHGTAGWLEVLLFLTGLAFLAIEIFAIPGLGIFGVGGVALCLLSLVLASQTFVIPRNDYQFAQLPKSLFLVGAAGMGVATGMFLLRRLLPHTPLLNRVMLLPPVAEELEDAQRREQMVHWSYLLGKRGTTTTRLTPSGKARFGDQLVDVISDGALIATGTAVTVVKVQGNHVLVTPVGELE